MLASATNSFGLLAPDPRSARLFKDVAGTGFVLGTSRLPRRGNRECSDYECAPVDHWMISSARSRSDWGIVSPSALAVLRLMTNSNFVGCSMGRSAGLAPFKMRATYTAVCAMIASKLGPYDI